MISFADKYPDLLSEWSWRNELSPVEVSYGSNKKILWQGACGHEWEATVKNRGNGHGCPYCSGNRVLIGFNDFASCFPEIAKEWSDLNHPHRPEDFTKQSPHLTWWKCPKCGHQWKARIADRVEGHGCPCCAGEKLVPEINSLAAVKAELAEEWSPKNSESPDLVWSRSTKMAWWICKKCGFEWKALINSRFRGQKCPACADRKLHSPYNSLAQREPWVLKEWNYEKNGDLLPTRILHNSMRPVWWKDRKGHQWRAKISDRLLGAGCPICERERLNAQPLEMIRYYSAKAGLYCRIAEESPIGIPLQVYYPDISSALEISPLFQRPSRKWENAKNWLCINAGIRLVRILTSKDDEYRNCICITREDDSEETLGLAISEAFRQLGIPVNIDMKDWLFFHNDAVLE